MRNNGDLLKTSMINEYIYCDFFDSCSIPARTSSSSICPRRCPYPMKKALLGAQMAREKHPDRKIYVMDTLCISGGLGLLVESMVARMEEGMDYDEVIAWGEAHKLKIAHRFTVDDLNYLKAGGRVSNASALVGSLLSVKPVLYVPRRRHARRCQEGTRQKGRLAEDPARDMDDLEVDTKGLTMHSMPTACRCRARAR